LIPTLSLQTAPSTTPTEPGLDGVCDLSVLDASATIITMGSRPFEMLTSYTPVLPDVGAYYGSGTGNRSLAGFHQYDGIYLTKVEKIEFEAQGKSGNLGVEVQLAVDLSCDYSQFSIVNVTLEQLTDRGPTDDDSGYHTYVADASVAQWTADNGLRKADDSVWLLPDHDRIGPPDGSNSRTSKQGLPGTLTSVVDDYPYACLHNGLTQQPFMPSGWGTSGIMLSLGDPSTNQKNVWWIREVRITQDGNTDVHGLP